VNLVDLRQDRRRQVQRKRREVLVELRDAGGTDDRAGDEPARV
jgi:hypothetical protein